MNKLKPNKISKSELLTLNEKDLLFITNPGRMGDEDGSTFIIKHDNELIIYRVDGWMYPNEHNNITLEDVFKQFPKWEETWKHNSDKLYKGKYKYIYMGFGNGLSIDNTIYKEYKPYLNHLVKERLKAYNKEEKKKYKYATIYNTWETAVINMAYDKKYILKI